jgi:HEPN domain-containing protein
MNRNDFQVLANTRLKEAEILISNKKYAGAYYLCGYAVECALKACIARQTNQYDFPDKRVVNESYTHSLNKLVKIAGLGEKFNQDVKKNKNFDLNWGIAKEWNESSRYERNTKKKAEELFLAVTEKQNGVLQWIKHHW